eukprot:TRINITY_DN10136_c0_g1_i9.p1 TRINITY_DN10136_c0_g1~~TRINITY_DN10136_c0_g1_i9.p1  ORF type:complete len:165 (+),score=33.40 TRINITY_DN10136_c0_g1_i9:187-681(+)
MEYITNDSIFLKYEKYLLEDCYGLYIPTIDVDIIDKDYQLYLSTYTNSVEFNKDFLRTIYPLLSKDEYDTMLESIKIMIKFNNKKKLNRKMKEMFYLTHPIFNININEYFELMKRYNEIDQMDKSPCTPVSYTHLTLPTICSVQISVVAVSLKKKKKNKKTDIV